MWKWLCSWFVRQPVPYTELDADEDLEMQKEFFPGCSLAISRAQEQVSSTMKENGEAVSPQWTVTE